MKKIVSISISLVIILTCIFTLSACSKGVDNTGLWENAVYLEDTTLGEGAKTITLQVSAEEQTVTFTVKTDKETVGEALLENKLINGEDSQYGLFIKAVNGITADYDVNQSYWAFYIDGEYATAGIDATAITEGVIYKLEYTK